MSASPPSTRPHLLVLGQVELVHAQGPSPERSRRACGEYLAWILRHPGHGATEMARDLLVAEATRRSNMSRLRSWLGRMPDGTLYLPDAYSGRVHVDGSISSDWDDLTLLVAPGIERTGDDALRQALGLVRGAPLADTAPGQWHWAEAWRVDMITTIRQLGVTLAQRALERRDLDLARWATGHALLADPGDEQLMIARIRTEHLASNHTEVHRLMLHVAAQARALGVELSDEMADLFQEVSEEVP